MDNLRTGSGLSASDFGHIRELVHRRSGISLANHKAQMVVSRLGKRLAALGLPDFGAYVRLLASPQGEDERELAVDLLTTNETYFFREPKHFEQLSRLARAHRGAEPFRVWSAASSSGEEPYTIAMILEDALGARSWEVFGSDISERMLELAHAGLYSLERATHVPPSFLKRYCLRGTGPHEGTLLVRRDLRERVRFVRVNLVEALPQLPVFDVIFLRNVLIYFELETKKAVVGRVVSRLKPQGTLFVSHTESLNGVADELTCVTPSVYRRP